MFDKQSLINKIEQAEIEKIIAYEDDDWTARALRSIFEVEWKLLWLRAILVHQKFPSNNYMLTLKGEASKNLNRYIKECDKHV